MVPNQQLQSIAVDDTAADGWVYDNLLVILPTGVNIKSVTMALNAPILPPLLPSFGPPGKHGSDSEEQQAFTLEPNHSLSHTFLLASVPASLSSSSRTAEGAVGP